MGLLIDGIWHDQGYDTKSTQGKFKRQPSTFRNWVTADGSSNYPAAAGRYHLYISLACPWACRALMMRQLKQLQDVISISIVDPLMLSNGWEFSNNTDCIPDTINNCKFLHEVYTLADPKFTGRVTVPVLWDKQTKTIINNESSEIMRMLNSEFNQFTDITTDYYPKNLRTEIDTINERIYSNINNGVYKCGFATTQQAYEQAFDKLFNELDWLENYLNQHQYLVGQQITEADLRLFTTLIRFDAVYHGHFKCNLKRLIDYPNISRYLSELYNHSNIADTINMDHIKNHYYGSHKNINPTGVIPKGPANIVAK